LNCDHYGKADFRVFLTLWRKSSPVSRYFAIFCFHPYVKKCRKKSQKNMSVKSVIIQRATYSTWTNIFPPVFTKGNKWKQMETKISHLVDYAVKPVAEHTSLERDSGNTIKPTIHRKIHPNPSHNQSNPQPIYEQR
jgi:hypothetical protein